MEIDPAVCSYTKCYCEENVWKLCERVKTAYPSQLSYCYCVFISNKERVIPLWCQKASKQSDGCVMWDYHVIFVFSPPNSTSLVYDLDTTLPFPCPFQQYAALGIKDNKHFKAQFHRFFRVIPAKEFLETFASDRTHMIKEDGKWMSEPPSYPCIEAEESKNNIQDFISMDAGVGYGLVLNFSEFLQRFGDPEKT